MDLDVAPRMSGCTVYSRLEPIGTVSLNFFEDWLGAGTLATVVAVVSVFIGAAMVYLVVRVAIFPLVRRAAHRTTLRWDDVLANHRFQHRLALLVPALIVYKGVSVVPGLSDYWSEAWRRLGSAAAILVGSMAVSALLMAFNTVYETLAVSKDRPIKGYLQVAQIVIYLFAGVFVVAVLADQSPWFFVSGLGAATAVVLLIFRDTILSFVASIQLAQNDMIRVGDWIEMPHYNADGDVVDIALHTVKVQNWDKTITTIPTYKLISESFKNWRGMSQAGGRRIKRSINIDMTSIRFLTDEEIDRFARFEPLVDYIATKRREIAQFNAVHAPPDGVTGDPRRLTNIGTLRAYLSVYLRRHPDLAADTMTFLIRQLPPGPHGLPLEIYVFSRDTRWARYEAIQADIFDHVLAMLGVFSLRAFQEPMGADVRFLSQRAE